MSRSSPLRWLAAAWALCAATHAVGAAAPAARWQCSPPGSAAIAPGIAEAARDYLDRVEALYPSQLLGLVRAGDRVYLLNSIDIEWGTRTRLALLALRLPEAYLTEEQRQTGASPGGRPPGGGYVCLAAGRAEREGLTRAPLGEIVLAAGQSVHLVNPQEPEVAVEVRAARDRPLNLGDIFQRSARAGIYAGLTGGASGQPGGSATLSMPGGTLIFRTASVGASAPAPKPEPAPVVVAVAPLPPPVEVQAVPAPVPPPVVEIVVAPAPVAAPAAPPPAPAVVILPAPAPVAEAVAALPAAAPAPPAVGAAGEQSYDDYAKAMKTMMALKRPGSVRSVGEMTYVHPAVEVFRRGNP